MGELKTATPFAASQPIASGLRLDKHWLEIGGGEGLVSPA